MVSLAHGVGGGRTDLPLPEYVFFYGAVLVLVVSFVALAALWSEPKLREPRFRPMPRVFSAVLLSRPVEILCGAIGVFLLGLVVWSGLSGVQTSTANFAPTFVYVIFWLGLVPISAIFGDVFRAFNPWRALGRLVSWVGPDRRAWAPAGAAEVPRGPGALAGRGRHPRLHVDRAGGLQR